MPFAERLNKRGLLLPLLTLFLAACASKAPSTDPAATAARPEASTDTPGNTGSAPKTGAQLGEIAATPLSDLNLMRAKIPPVLLAAQKNPYALPEDASCSRLATDVRAIDAVLGADLDMPPNPDHPGMLERGVDLVGETALGAVRGAAEGIIPFRSWVRKLTGAERRSRELAAAIAAGGIRRAFLKGLGQAAGCPPPAAPRTQADGQQCGAKP